MDKDALFDAAQRGDVDALDAILNHGGDLDFCDEGWLGPPIVLAVNNGHEEAARWLLENGVSVPPTLLATACYSNRLRRRRDADHMMWLIRELLLERDADPNHCGAGEMLPLGCVDDVELARLLIDNGADPTLADGEGGTPLHNAARISDPDLIALLIERGADPLARDDDGRTPLDIAREDGDAEVIAALGG